MSRDGVLMSAPTTAPRATESRMGCDPVRPAPGHRAVPGPTTSVDVIDEAEAPADGGGRTEFLTALYDRHAAEVYRFLYRRCGDADLAEDLAHDTFLAAARAVDDPTELTVAWLMRVARNRLIDVLRRQSRYETRLHLLGSDDDLDDLGGVVAERLRVRDALRTIKVEYRVVLLLHYVDGMSVPEVAHEMGRSIAAVESLVRRARGSLVRQLEKTHA